MKKIFASFLSILMIAFVAFSFGGCDRYQGKTYNMTSAVFYNSNGSEYSVMKYKDFFNFNIALLAEIENQYDIDVNDIITMKEYLSQKYNCSINFNKDGSLIFESTTTIDKLQNKTEVKTWVGNYTYEKETFIMLFKNYKLATSGTEMKDPEGKSVYEDSAKLMDFVFGDDFVVSVPDEKTIEFTFYQGVSESSDRAVLTFVLE